MLRRAVGIIGTIVMLAAAAVVVPQRGGADSTKDVLVVNAPSQPVPVSLTGGTGTANVNVTNQPTVDLAAGTTIGISGTPNVNIANQPTVSIAPDSVLHVSNGDALQPVLTEVKMLLVDGKAGVVGTVFTVPDGKRLVLEDVSGSAILPAGQSMNSIGIGDEITNMFVPATFSGPYILPGYDTYQFGRLARGYWGPRAHVEGIIERNSASGLGTVYLTLTGYLIELP
jgi:hypothetical protein